MVAANSSDETDAKRRGWLHRNWSEQETLDNVARTPEGARADRTAAVDVVQQYTGAFWRRLVEHVQCSRLVSKAPVMAGLARAIQDCALRERRLSPSS